MDENDQRLAIHRTLVRLWQEHFFLEPKTFAQTYRELVTPSPTRADISYDKRQVSDELRRLVRDGKLSMQGRANEVVYIERD